MVQLTSDLYEVVKVRAKTRSKTWKYLEKGDIIKFSASIHSTSGASGGGNYAFYVFIEVFHKDDAGTMTPKLNFYESLNMIDRFLTFNFKIETINEDKKNN